MFHKTVVKSINDYCLLNKKKSKMLKFSIGRDVSSEKMDGCFSVIDTIQKVTVKSIITISNNGNGLKCQKIGLLNTEKEATIPLVICTEATCVYYESCALYLFEKKA